MYFTERQLKILNFIRGYILDHDFSPTLDEIAEFFEIKKATAHEHVGALEKKGALRRAPHQARSIELADDPRASTSSFEPPSPRFAPDDDQAFSGVESSERDRGERLTRLPILGSIQAGLPLEAVPDESDLDLESWLDSGKGYYVLAVRGQSMIEDGIHDGDFVVVEKRSTARNGEVVVALVDGQEATLKRFYREDGRVRLQPANSSMDPIYRRDVLVQGVVAGLLRRY